MGLFSKKPKEQVVTAQDRALAAFESNTIKLPGMALNNEMFSTAGQYDGKPKKEHQAALTQFLTSRRAKAVYPESAWSGVVFLFPNSDGTVSINADGVTIDQLSKEGAKAFLETTTAPVPVWCEIKLIGKEPYTRLHVQLQTKKPKPRA